jgi:shikimate kinase
MRIFLIGMPGCGKSYWGKQLAQELNIPLIDLDTEIVHYSQSTIQELFDKGEYYFRLKEHEVLKNMLVLPNNAVVSCGGGTPCFFNNLYHLLAKGSVVYLEASTDVLFNRLWTENDARPLLNNANQPEELKKLLEDLFEKRKAHYLQAHHIINVDDEDRDRIFGSLMKVVQI